MYCTGRTTRAQPSELERPETIEETAELVQAAGDDGIAVQGLDPTPCGSRSSGGRGGADAEIVRRFSPLLARAERGELDDWSRAARSRLALIVTSRPVPAVGASRQRPRLRQRRDRARPDAGGPRQRPLRGAHGGLGEDLLHAAARAIRRRSADLELAVTLAEEIARDAPAALRGWFDFSVGQARGNRDVIAHFGRHPHRNEALGRTSTPEELAYIARGDFVHKRTLPR